MTPSRSALILVRNTVTHDARILREAGTLRRLGLNVLIAGVVSTVESEEELEIGGFPVMRLAPAACLRSVLRRGGDRPVLVPKPTRAVHPPAALRRSRPGSAVVSRFAVLSPRTRLRRLVLTMAYYVQGIGLVLRTSPSLVHANDYNTMWIATAAKLLRHSKLVYDSHELWPDRNRRPEWRPWLVACEALFVRVADASADADRVAGAAEHRDSAA